MIQLTFFLVQDSRLFNFTYLDLMIQRFQKRIRRIDQLTVIFRDLLLSSLHAPTLTLTMNKHTRKRRTKDCTKMKIIEYCYRPQPQ